MKRHNTKEAYFSPLFIVGAPRSGTTMLAVILDRHSEIAIPPETQFFSEFLPQHTGLEQENREKMVDLALNFNRIADLCLDKDRVLNNFKRYPKTSANLLRSILTSYAESNGKSRPGEKSPRHIEHVPVIFNSFPFAKVICLVRDGRDVVRSLNRVPWAEPGNPRRFGLFCMEWSDLANKAIAFKKTCPPDRFRLVKFEDILLNPKREIKNLCDFIGEEFESRQLDHLSGSAVIPSWENDWKGKASKMLDASRIFAWKKEAGQIQIWTMNSMMGTTLEKMGYPNTSLLGCPFPIKIKLLIMKIPYLKFMRPVSLFALRLLRLIKLIK